MSISGQILILIGKKDNFMKLFKSLLALTLFATPFLSAQIGTEYKAATAVEKQAPLYVFFEQSNPQNQFLINYLKENIPR